MCANFTPIKKNQWVKDKLGVELPADCPAESYPGFAATLVVKSHQSDLVAGGLTKFGLIPSCAKDEKIARHTYNARSETAAEKPSYRTAWRQRQYGLVLFDNFYEPSYESGRAVRWRIALASVDPWIACLRKRWAHPASCELVVSFSMLTVNAEERPVMRQFHKLVDERRTPVIIAPDLHDAWLSADTAKAPELMTFLPWYGRRELARKWLCEASIYGATCKKVARAVV